jgi:predicted DNA-binding transcriptional regulator AlpA
MEFLSYDDLVRMRVVRSRETLRRWRKNEGFPEPRTIGRHVVWRAEEVMLWVEQHGSSQDRGEGINAWLKEKANSP